MTKRNAFADSPPFSLTASLFKSDQLVDIRDLSVSDNGQQLLMSMKVQKVDANEDEQTSWNIWHYDLTTKKLSRVMANDALAEQGNDLMPSFLPDGRIVFASTRQRLSRAILLDEGKPQYTALDENRDNETFNIHVMNPDGSAIKQLSFNLSHDFYPLVMQNGQILYSRWDLMGANHGINLYRMNPDGTNNELVFGWHSHQIILDSQTEVVEYIKPQQLPSGEILMMLTSRTDSTAINKRPVTININDYIDANQATATSGAQDNAINDVVLADFDFNFSQGLSPTGRINHLFPIPDNSNRYLMSWDLCRVVINDQIKSCGQLTQAQLADENIVLAPAFYELWLLDNANKTQQLVATTEQGKILTEAVVMQPSAQPKTFIADKVVGNELDAQLSLELAGSIHIRSVYDFDGIDSTANIGGITRLSDPSKTPAANLPARFLRIVRGVPMPPDDVRDVANTDFGRSNNQLMREIIGYTPIQPDGSVKIKVPANVPLAISVLDMNGKRIGGRHRQWISLKPGETLECTGCHTANSQLPHGRTDAQVTSINTGAAAGGSPYPNASANIIPSQGQTMAEADEMVNGLPQLTADLRYQDIWTNPAISAINPALEYAYSNMQTLAPNGAECFTHWTTYCRLQINYVEHIQPLWDLPRPVIDEATQVVVANSTCTTCHNMINQDGVSQVPAGQLALSNMPSSDQVAHLTSYRELFFNDVEQEEIDGIIIDRLIEVLDAEGNPVYQVDSNGELILDAEGNPIPVLTTVNVPAILSTNGARASSNFFDVMNNATHQNMLTKDELKLLNEWLDIGAQYYNTPFYPLP
ncbi:hypothetical protein [Shewanella sp. OMA3-2]|uniref:HzsA-related protein n=1 Tax=Shewanella sp. OMA3-2 TaxID=2908650 RepID=UPI001F41E68A|nr:hypothetical protein [Shewanella sp. OMA3-2]UJF21175.1 hypothetical protein L0B17_13665 [Shewanella sp. OMA3-2]